MSTLTLNMADTATHVRQLYIKRYQNNSMNNLYTVCNKRPARKTGSRIPRISLLNCCVHELDYEVMLRSLIKSLRVVLIVVVLLTIYYAGYHLSESIFYRGRVAASYAGNNIIISNIMTTINNKFDDNFLPVSNNSSKSILSSDLHPPDRSDINIYFTVKTTPGNYAKRIRPLQISWFQKVNKEMVSGARDSCLLSTTK